VRGKRRRSSSEWSTKARLNCKSMISLAFNIWIFLTEINLEFSKGTVFFGVNLCSPLELQRCIGGICYLHLQDPRANHARNQGDEGGSTSLRNVGALPQKYTVIHFCGSVTVQNSIM
jgi:hypothetical protein